MLYITTSFIIYNQQGGIDYEYRYTELAEMSKLLITRYCYNPKGVGFE